MSKVRKLVDSLKLEEAVFFQRLARGLAQDSPVAGDTFTDGMNDAVDEFIERGTMAAIRAVADASGKSIAEIDKHERQQLERRVESILEAGIRKEGQALLFALRDTLADYMEES